MSHAQLPLSQVALQVGHRDHTYTHTDNTYMHYHGDHTYTHTDNTYMHYKCQHDSYTIMYHNCNRYKRYQGISNLNRQLTQVLNLYCTGHIICICHIY